MAGQVAKHSDGGAAEQPAGTAGAVAAERPTDVADESAEPVESAKLAEPARRVEPAAHRVGPALRRGTVAGWRGVRVARRYLARLIVWAALAVALLLGVGALLVGFGANPHNVLVSWVVSAGDRIDGPFGDLFTYSDHVKQTLVNWVIAAVAYLAAGGILARLIRP